MGNLWLKIKVWTKIVLFSALSLYALLFMYNNWDNRVELWIWFHTTPTRSVLLYMLFAFLTGVIGTILVRTLVRTAAQIRELRERARNEKTERRLAAMNSKASRLQQRAEPVVEPSVDSTLALRPKALTAGKAEARPVETPSVIRPEAIPVSEPASSDNGTPR